MNKWIQLIWVVSILSGTSSMIAFAESRTGENSTGQVTCSQVSSATQPPVRQQSVPSGTKPNTQQGATSASGDQPKK